MVNRSINDWVQEGSEREDDGNRFCNHFHNPLLTWNQAGLEIPFPIICPTTNHSSVLWGQNPDLQPVGEKFAWQNARQRYFDGLTASTQTVREQNLALAFETVGHLIHLVQDSAVPAHTRNDPHPPIINPDGFETFVESIRLTPQFDELTSISTPFNPSILALAPNKLAPVPIAHIIDTDQPAAIPSTGTDIGLAEYSNGNFLSDDRMFPSFTFPRVESLDLTMPEVINGVTYFPKVRDGEQVKHFVAQDQFGTFFLDSVIFTDYAARLLPPQQPNLLLPRAVGYSAGLIDYFFRGRLEIVVAPNQPCTPPITQVNVDVRNNTPGEETGTGQIVAVVSSGTSFFVSSPQIVPLTRTLQRLVFDFSKSPLPSCDADRFLTLVYDGPLGLEQRAVIVGGNIFTRVSVCHGDCFNVWRIDAREATLTIRGSGAGNNGRVVARGFDSGGECIHPECGDVTFPVSFIGPTTLSFTAPAAPDTVFSEFLLDISVQPGGFMCLLNVSGTPLPPTLEVPGGFISEFCPQ